MTALYELRADPGFTSPVLLVALEGWIDAGLGASSAMKAVLDQLAPVTVAEFDADELIDYRARRPSMLLQDGVNTELSWPGIELKAGRDPEGNEVLLLVGHEPDSRWRAFADAVVELSSQLGVRIMHGFGAYPFATPHTRPSMVSCTASSEQVAASIGLLRNSVTVPAGMEAVLERRFAERGLPAAGLWAQVPHYVANAPYPGAAVALLDTLSRLTGLRFSTDELRDAHTEHAQRVDALVAQSAEHVAMVRQLESQYDALATMISGSTTPGPLPSGDELAAELERFLRDQPRPDSES